jgi:hypothetical protein
VRPALVAVTAACFAVPAVAEPFVFSGVVQGGAGFATNPYFREGQDQSAPLVSISLTPTLTRKTPRGVTTIRGVYSREEYLSRYGKTENANASAFHSEQLTEQLGIDGRVAFATTNNALIGQDYDPTIVDPLTLGQRSRRVDGSTNLQWRPSARDSFSAGVNAGSTNYKENEGTLLARDYDEVGGNVAYSRVLDARTSVGVQVVGTLVDSKAFPDTKSLQPAVTFQRQFNEIWNLSGNVGLIIQSIDGSKTSTSLGFGASLCATYPRTNFCFEASRQSSSSGVGGLRNDLQFAVTVNHDLTERSRVQGYVSYKDSDSRQAVTAITGAKVLQSRLDYYRDLTERLAVGVGGRYQRRSYSGRSGADSLAGTVNLTLKIGRRS